MEKFDKDYVCYWKDRVKNISDGSKVADEDIIDFYVTKMEISKNDKVLDLGCGFGRLYAIIEKYTKNIIGIDTSDDPLKEASKYPYLCLVKGSAENTHMASHFFDKIIAWAVYDVVAQEKGLIEENRILMDNGLLLITGKNYDYHDDDRLAFIAERNAKLKKFPNHFTDVYKLIEKSYLFGFDVSEAYGFKKRGDFGQNNYIDILKENPTQFYEYLLILKKIGEPGGESEQIAHEYSATATKMAKEHKFSDVLSFFEWHKTEFGEE